MPYAATIFRTTAFLAAIFLQSATAQAASNLAECRLDLAASMRKLTKSNDKETVSCLKDSSHPWCWYIEDSFPNPLREVIAEPGSACEAAVVDDAVPISQIAPENCPSGWSDWSCSSSYDLASAADCQLCLEGGRRHKILYDLDVEGASPDEDADRACVVRAYRAVSRAVSAGLADATGCAKRGGEPPWSCTIGLDPDSKFGKALAGLARKVSRCESLITTAGSSVPRLCNRAVVSLGDFAQCLRESALCSACQAANAVLGTNQDCIALSGDRRCDVTLDEYMGRSRENRMLVTNRGDDTLMLFETTEESAEATIAVGNGPVDVAASRPIATAYVLNGLDETVTFVDLTTGAYSFGSLLPSTFAVGNNPSALAVNEARSIVYVANEDDSTVTFLDAWDGSYVHGDLASSSHAAGAGPGSVAVNEDDGILYVANSGDDTVTFLDAATGAPMSGTLVDSTYPVGNEPRHVLYDAQTQRIVVTNHGDGTVTFLDALTGAPAFGTLLDSTKSAGTGAIASAASGDAVFTSLKEGEGVSALSIPPYETIYGEFAALSLTAGGATSDLAVAAGVANRLYVTLRDADAVGWSPIFAADTLFGLSDGTNSTLMAEIPYWGGSMTNDPATGDFLVPTRRHLRSFEVIDPDDFTNFYLGSDWDYDSSEIVRYYAAGNVVLGSYLNRLKLWSRATGSLLTGSPATSVFSAICDGDNIEDLAISQTEGIAYVRCEGSVVYLDAATGAFLTGSKASSTVVLDGSGRPDSMVVDEAGGRVFLGDRLGTASAVVALDAGSPAYANGTLAASKIVVDTDGEALELNADGGILYRGYGDGTVKLFGLTGNLLATAEISGAYSMEFAVSPARNRLYVVGSFNGPNGGLSRLTYLHADDGSLIGSTLEDSSITIAPPQSNVVEVSPVHDFVAVKIGFSVGLLDAFSPAFVHEPTAFYRTFPVGDSPSAIASVLRYLNATD